MLALGDNSLGQLNIPPIPAGTSVVKIAAGWSDSFALLNDGSLLAWGQNASGQVNVPPLPPGVGYVDVAAGEAHSLALRSNGTVVAWGDNGYGQCNVPALLAGESYTRVEAGRSRSIGVYRSTAWSTFCSGDGSGTACPCGNSGLVAHGCASSVSANGARLVGSGQASLASDTFLLSGSEMPNSFALYFQGTTQQSGGSGSVFGDGLRCAGGAVVRLGTHQNASGASRHPDAGGVPISVKGGITSPGTRTYQVWYRNAAAYCTPSTFNLTNGVEVTWSM
jgi:hypothetical protein